MESERKRVGHEERTHLPPTREGRATASSHTPLTRLPLPPHLLLPATSTPAFFLFPFLFILILILFHHSFSLFNSRTLSPFLSHTNTHSLSLTLTLSIMTRISLGLVSLLALSSAVSIVSAHEGHDHGQHEFLMPGDADYNPAKDDLAEFKVRYLSLSLLSFHFVLSRRPFCSLSLSLPPSASVSFSPVT